MRGRSASSQSGVIEVKSFTSRADLPLQKQQAAGYAKTRGHPTATLALFVPTDDKELLPELPTTQLLSVDEQRISAATVAIGMGGDGKDSLCSCLALLHRPGQTSCAALLTACAPPASELTSAKDSDKTGKEGEDLCCFVRRFSRWLGRCPRASAARPASLVVQTR